MIEKTDESEMQNFAIIYQITRLYQLQMVKVNENFSVKNICQNDKKLYIKEYLRYKILIDEVINIGKKKKYFFIAF